MRFLIWSLEHEAFWNPGRMGYTRNINNAGRYQEGEAREICEMANRGGYEEEIMLPAPEPKEEQ